MLNQFIYVYIETYRNIYTFNISYIDVKCIE